MPTQLPAPSDVPTRPPGISTPAAIAPSADLHLCGLAHHRARVQLLLRKDGSRCHRTHLLARGPLDYDLCKEVGSTQHAGLKTALGGGRRPPNGHIYKDFRLPRELVLTYIYQAYIR